MALNILCIISIALVNGNAEQFNSAERRIIAQDGSPQFGHAARDTMHIAQRRSTGNRPRWTKAKNG